MQAELEWLYERRHVGVMITLIAHFAMGVLSIIIALIAADAFSDGGMDPILSTGFGAFVGAATYLAVAFLYNLWNIPPGPDQPAT